MNVIVGAISMDGPVDEHLRREMSTAAYCDASLRLSMHSGPDMFMACYGSVGGLPCLVHDVARNCWIAWDGRIDNRAEIIDASGVRNRQISDAELALRAFQLWGEACPSKIIGDFAFAVWDAANRSLFCARDPFGIRPLFYLAKKRVIYFSSQIPPLRAAGQNQTQIDPEYIADFIATSLPSLTEKTPFPGLLRLLPRQALLWKDGEARVKEYWDFPTREYLSRLDERQCSEEFLSLFQTAVQCRLGPSTTYADLSGGFDSSAIVCVAAQALKDRKSALQVITQRFSESKRSDETRWSEPVAAQYRLAQVLIDVDAERPMSDLQESPIYWDEPSHQQVFLPIAKKYKQLCVAGLPPILLVGIGAEAIVMDDVFRPIHLSDLLQSGQLLALVSELKRWQKAGKVPLSNMIIAFCLKPIFRRLGEYALRIKVEPPPYVSSKFAQAWDVGKRANRAHQQWVCNHPAMQYQYERIGRLPVFCYRGFMEKHLDIRYPFLDRRLVEFALQVPWTHKLDPSLPKPLLLRAMAGTVPTEVLDRRMTTTFGHAVYKAIAREWYNIEPLLKSSLVSEMGFVDGARFRRSVEQARLGHAQDLPAVLSTLALETWLRHHLGMNGKAPVLNHHQNRKKGASGSNGACDAGRVTPTNQALQVQQ